MRKVEDKMGEKIRRAIVALKWSYFYWPLPLAGAATEVFFRPANTPRDADVTNCWTERDRPQSGGFPYRQNTAEFRCSFACL